MTETAESKFAPVLRERGFEQVPEGGVLRDLLENSKFIPDVHACLRHGMWYSQIGMFGLQQTAAIDDVGMVWLAQRHVDLDDLGFVRGKFEFELTGAVRLQ